MFPFDAPENIWKPKVLDLSYKISTSITTLSKESYCSFDYWITSILFLFQKLIYSNQWLISFGWGGVTMRTYESYAFGWVGCTN